MKHKTLPSDSTLLRPLTRDEIDRRIDGVIKTVAIVSEGEETEAATDLRPRWISAAELVRRMRPFVVLN